ncbi:MAG TPA: hypothetical protein ENG87_05805 [Candidatus Pacearchaeota archaeon]|nr:hypothetical protein [Candidatus Pacearchaeota archaeon]HDZ60173.1 hypothetical protein [Candidatus Pacearchaeota archaeon]
MSKEKEKSKFGKLIIFIIEKIIGAEGLFMAGEGIKDLVVCYIVISVLINQILYNPPITSKFFVLAICLAIMLVPFYYCSKWLSIVFQEENKEDKK